MALKTPAEFRQSISADLQMQIYMFGEKIDDCVDHSVIRPSINRIAMTEELARLPEDEDLMRATSHLTGKKVNRFTHIHQSTGDLSKKVKMQRLLGQKTGSCFQCCVGMDTVSALYSVTCETGQARGTRDHERVKKYVRYLQDNDLVADGAMTDPKGDRSLAPPAARTRRGAHPPVAGRRARLLLLRHLGGLHKACGPGRRDRRRPGDPHHAAHARRCVHPRQ
jgi:4-hydroxybutyryl-CoA dehydratase/vinylacetyl-CoA-Delta-isomerase